MKTLDAIFKQKMDELRLRIKKDSMAVSLESQKLSLHIVKNHPEVYNSFFQMIEVFMFLEKEFQGKKDNEVLAISGVAPFFSLIWLLLDANEEYKAQLKK